MRNSFFPSTARCWSGTAAAWSTSAAGGDHYIDLLAGVPELTGIQLSQPECNDMEKIYRHTVDRGIPLFGLPLEAAEQALACGRPLHGLVHCC